MRVTVVGRMSSIQYKSLLDGLTLSERLVAVHLAQGMSNKEIASLLGKAEPTVKHQVSSILRTTHSQSRCRFIAAYHQQALSSLMIKENASSLDGILPAGKKLCAGPTIGAVE